MIYVLSTGDPEGLAGTPAEGFQPPECHIISTYAHALNLYPAKEDVGPRTQVFHTRSMANESTCYIY